MSDKPLRRLPLRQLLANSDKTTRDLIEMLWKQFIPCVSDYRDLTRPVRRKSSYPTMQSFLNGLRRVTEGHEQIDKTIKLLHEHLEVIREHAKREKINRK